VVSWGKGRCVVGRGVFDAGDVLRVGAALVCFGFGGDSAVLGSTGAGGLADGVDAGGRDGVYAGARDGAWVLVGAIVGAMVGAGGGGVAVTGIVGMTAPVGPTGSRDTTRSADTAMATATNAMALSAITAVTVPYQGSPGSSSMASESSRSPSSTVMSELFGDGGLLALRRTRCLHGEDQPDAAGVVLVLAGPGGIE
jgi:hypothetical protein